MSGSSVSEERIGETLRGAFDLNCRCAPATGYVLDPWDSAEEALALGMGGLVFRDDGYCTAPIAAFLAETEFSGKPVSLTGSVALNNISGGFNFYAAEHALKLCGRVVSMPTLSAENRLRMARWPSAQELTGPARPRSLAAVDSRDRITPEVVEVIETVADFDGVLDAGALHVSEVLVVFREAARRGVKRLLASDPVRRNVADAVDIREMVDMGAAIEFLPQPGGADRDLIGLVLDKAPGQLVLGLDTGPSNASTLRDRYAEAIRFWADFGLDLQTIRDSISSNIAGLLGIRPARSNN